MIYRFEAFELDTDRFELRQDGTPIPVERQVLTLLALLVKEHARMVSKDEIHEHVWAGRIVSEAALSSRIRSARQVIGDDGKAQRLIRTVHGSGFRFVGSVEAPPNPVSAPPPPSAGPSMSRPTIAVLPFSNQSIDAEQEHFADGITSDIISTLSKHRWLSVVARNTTFGYKGQAVNIPRLAAELGASYVVDGTVRRAGQRIRVTVQLIDAQTGNHRWAERYDRNLEDVFAVQDEITETIVARLEPEIGSAERQKVVRSGSTDLQAWEAFHLGTAHFFKFTASGNLEAQRYLQQSRELDPQFGEAHAWWAYAVVLGMVYWDNEPSDDLLNQALDATRKALEIDDRNAVFYALKARVQLARGEYDRAIDANEHAINLNPTLAAAHCGLADSLAYQGHYDDAICRFEKAINLSPNDPQRWAFLTYGALALIFKGNYAEAVQWADRASLIPNHQYWTYAHRVVALALQGETAAAKTAATQLIQLQPNFTCRFAKRKLFYVKNPTQLQTYVSGLTKAGIPA